MAVEKERCATKIIFASLHTFASFISLQKLVMFYTPSPFLFPSKYISPISIVEIPNKNSQKNPNSGKR